MQKATQTRSRAIFPSECQLYGKFLADTPKLDISLWHVLGRFRTGNRCMLAEASIEPGDQTWPVLSCEIDLVPRPQLMALFVDHVAKTANLQTVFVRPQSPDRNALHETTQ